MSNSLFSPLPPKTPRHTSSGSSQRTAIELQNHRNIMVGRHPLDHRDQPEPNSISKLCACGPSEVALGSPHSGCGLQALTPADGQKKAGQQEFFLAAVFGSVAFFQFSFTLWLRGVVTHLTRQGVAGLQGAAADTCTAAQCSGPAGGKQCLYIPSGAWWKTALILHDLTSWHHFLSYLKLQISNQTNILVSASGSPQFHSEAHRKLRNREKH